MSPIHANASVIRLRGYAPSVHRLSVGPWRVIFEKETELIRILRVKHRREAYRKSTRIHQEFPGQPGLPDDQHPDDLTDEELVEIQD